MIKMILSVSAVIIVIAALFNFTLPEFEKNYHQDAYKLLRMTDNTVHKEKIDDIYDIILMDGFVSEEEFDMFYEEILDKFPHIKKYGLNLKE